MCTLLGPEGPGRSSSDDRTDLLDFVRLDCFGFLVEEYRPYFENYTVDASILKMRTKWERTSVRERIVRVTNYPDSPRGCSGLLM